MGLALPYRPIQNGCEALFTSAAALIDTLSTASSRGELAQALARYTHPHILVIDSCEVPGYVESA